jgi:hypothetical protein
MRNAIRGVNLVLVVLLVAILSVGFWVRREVNNTDRFVGTVASLSAEPEVQAAVASRISSQIESRVDDVDVAEKVPGDVGTLYKAAEPRIESAIQSFLASDQFQTFWVDAIRAVHPIFKDLLTGKDTENLETQGNEIRINLYPVYEAVAQRLEERDRTLLSDLNPDPDRFWVTVFEADRLVDVQDGLKAVNRLLFLGAVILAVLVVAYLYLSRNRWRAAAWLALAVVVGLLLQRAVLSIARSEMLDALKDSPDQDIARLFFDALVDDLERLVLYAGIVSLLVAIFFLGYDYFRTRRSSAPPVIYT